MTRAKAKSRVSREELERRWTAIRAAMADAGIAALITQSDAGAYPGYGRYLADLVPDAAAGLTVVFPREGAITVIRQGGTQQDIEHDPADHGELRGIGRVLTTGYYPGLSYTAAAEAAQIVEALRPWAEGRIGFLGERRISMAAADALRKGLPRAEFVDATDVLDPIIARKSDEEKDFIRQTAQLQDAVLAHVLDQLKPGLFQSDVVAMTERLAFDMGASHGFALCASAPVGTPSIPRKSGPDRKLEKGDLVYLLLESDGPGGYYVHLTRGAVLGNVPATLSDEIALALDVQQYLADVACGGITGAELDVLYREKLSAVGRPYTGGSYCHSHGYDIMQRPVARVEESLRFDVDMNIGVHPTYIWEGSFIWVCSNFLTAAGGAELIHAHPNELRER
jgi:Xaa-Pro aminopeptidase